MSFHSRNSCSFITSFSCLVGAVLVVLLFVTIVFQNGNGSTFPLFSEQIIGTAIRGMYSMPLSSLETNATRHLIPFDATSSIINNDEKWLDNQGVEIKAARAATLSRHKIDGFWYMVGSESNETWGYGGDIYLYKSLSLGSNSWQMVNKIFDVELDEPTTSNCYIHQKPMDRNMFFVHCRNRVFVSENGVEGNYTDYTGDKWLGIPWTEFDLGALRVGNTAAFEENGTMYIATTRLQTNTNLQDRRRYFFIYRLDDSWTHLVEDEEERIVAWWEFPNFESPYITTGDGWYYLFGSQTNGWGESRTRYRRARSLAELATASDSFVYMHPADNNNIKSMGTQFSFFHKLDNDRWIFGGRRHPIEDPDQFDSKYGKLVMAPATFINGIPNAFWKYSFDWETYDFDNSDFDSHSHYGYGHKPCPTCPTPVPTGNPSLNQIITPSTVLPTLSSSRPSSYEPSIIPSPVPFSLSPISPPTPQPSEATGRKSFLPSSALSSSSPYLPLTARPSLAVAETPSRTSTSNSERQVSNFAGLLGLGLNLLAIL